MFVNVDGAPEPKKFVVSSLQDLEDAIGQEFITPSFQMAPDRIRDFERATYLDVKEEEYGRPSSLGYGEGLLEGFHLLGMLDYLLTSVIAVDPSFTVTPWNYGLDRVRFVSVLRLEDRFRLRATVSNAQWREGGVLVSFDVVAEVDGRQRPGFIATFHSFWAQADQGIPTPQRKG